MKVPPYRLWLLHHHKTPIEQTGIPAGAPPLPKNGLTLALMVVTASLFLVWMATALPVILLLFAFPLLFERSYGFTILFQDLLALYYQVGNI